MATGLYPERGISRKYRSSQNTPSDYKLAVQADDAIVSAVQNARSRIWASGIALSKFKPDVITQKVKSGVDLRFFYLDPCGASVIQRAADENNPDAAANITLALTRLGYFSKDFDNSQRQSLHVTITEAYPTMVVMIIDHNLYAYFCPYGAVCTTSPILIFDNYQDNPQATFFETNFNSIYRQAKAVDLQGFKPCSGSANSPSSTATPVPSVH